MLKAHFVLLTRFCLRFGFFHGVRLFLQFKLKLLNHVKLPGFKHAFKLRPRSSDIDVFNQVFLEQQFDIRLTNTPQLIIDGGSNIGLFAIIMKQRYPGAKIFCVEPDPGNFQLLRANTAPYRDIICEQYGLWDKDGLATLSDPNNLGSWGMVVSENMERGEIPIISMASFLSKHGIEQVDILKLDIEASETRLFSGNIEDWLSCVRTIIIELHDWFDVGCAQTFFRAIDRSFRSYTFSVKGENTIITNLDPAPHSSPARNRSQ